MPQLEVFGVSKNNLRSFSICVPAKVMEKIEALADERGVSLSRAASTVLENWAVEQSRQSRLAELGKEYERLIGRRGDRVDQASGHE